MTPFFVLCVPLALFAFLDLCDWKQFTTLLSHIFSSPAGFALFELKDEGKLDKPEKLYSAFSDIEKAKKLYYSTFLCHRAYFRVSLKSFRKFQDTAEALSAATAIVEGKLETTLEKLIEKSVVGKGIAKLAVADKKLGQAIHDKFSKVEPVSGTAAQELFRYVTNWYFFFDSCLDASASNSMVSFPKMGWMKSK